MLCDHSSLSHLKKLILNAYVSLLLLYLRCSYIVDDDVFCSYIELLQAILF